MSDDTAADRDGLEPIRVLHVDDDPDFVELAATFLERADDRFVVEMATSVDEGLDCLAETDVDCVVSDYEMPDRDGIEFLETVRTNHDSLPFILFTGKGSESVASEAISAGITDYLRKRTGAEQYDLLANRIENAVDATRSRRLLTERTRRLETLISNLPGIVYRCRNETGWPMETVEGEVAQLTGYDGECLERGDVSWGPDIVHPDDRTSVWDAVQEGLADDRTFEVTYRIATADGTTKWVWERGRVVESASDGTDVLEGFITDITDRVERERELERRTDELESKYRHLFEEAPIMAVVTRAEDGRPVVDDCNRQFVETLGYDRDDVVDAELASFYTPESRRKLLHGGYDRALTGEFMRENRGLVTADGAVIETVLHAVPRHDVHDEIVGTLALYVDVDERKALERQKERLEEFASIVSHDLRNPLNVAQSRTRLAREDCDTEHLDHVTRAHDRMASLIDDLLTLARSGEGVGDLESVDLATLAERCWANIPTADATLVVETAQSIRADRSRLRQLLQNLFSNSVEHGSTGNRRESAGDSVEHGSTSPRSQTPEDAVEHSSTSNQTQSDDTAEHGGADVTVTVGALDDGFYVADDGHGIPESMRETVFEAGYSTAEDGTGFGLRIVERVADAHGWTVDAAESEGGGARFEVRGVEFVDRA
jgi:PAS domain S-box-containing protein